jgi:hypothetical protein
VERFSRNRLAHISSPVLLPAGYGNPTGSPPPFPKDLHHCPPLQKGGEGGFEAPWEIHLPFPLCQRGMMLSWITQRPTPNSGNAQLSKEKERPSPGCGRSSSSGCEVGRILLLSGPLKSGLWGACHRFVTERSSVCHEGLAYLRIPIIKGSSSCRSRLSSPSRTISTFCTF